MISTNLIEKISTDGHLDATILLTDRGVVEYSMDVAGIDKALLFAFLLSPVYKEL